MLILIEEIFLNLAIEFHFQTNYIIILMYLKMSPAIIRKNIYIYIYMCVCVCVFWGAHKKIIVCGCVCVF